VLHAALRVRVLLGVGSSHRAVLVADLLVSRRLVLVLLRERVVLGRRRRNLGVVGERRRRGSGEGRKHKRGEDRADLGSEGHWSLLGFDSWLVAKGTDPGYAGRVPIELEHGSSRSRAGPNTGAFERRCHL